MYLNENNWYIESLLYNMFFNPRLAEPKNSYFNVPAPTFISSIEDNFKLITLVLSGFIEKGQKYNDFKTYIILGLLHADSHKIRRIVGKNKIGNLRYLLSNIPNNNFPEKIKNYLPHWIK